MDYLAYVVDTTETEARLEDILVVREFPDVFPDDLPELPPDREIEFEINLIMRTAPIARSSYRMTPTELNELKVQLEELVSKGLV